MHDSRCEDVERQEHRGTFWTVLLHIDRDDRGDMVRGLYAKIVCLLGGLASFVILGRTGGTKLVFSKHNTVELTKALTICRRFLKPDEGYYKGGISTIQSNTEHGLTKAGEGEEQYTNNACEV